MENIKNKNDNKGKEMEEKPIEYNTVYLRKMDVSRIKSYFDSNAENILANKISNKVKKNVNLEEKNNGENKVWDMLKKKKYKLTKIIIKILHSTKKKGILKILRLIKF